MYSSKCRLEPGKKVSIKDLDPGDTMGFSGGEEKALKETARLVQKLADLQNLLYAEHKHKLLVVLQGVDTAGKDGTIRHVFSAVGPQGVRVANFRKPTEEELDHDYLWRIHKETPAKGEIVIFNRSHYEDVLAVRVRDLAPKDVWKNRYDSINCFERMLTEEGATVLKFFLNIDADEQKKRIAKRLTEPRHQWKFAAADLEESKLLPQYLEAYEDVLNKTGTAWAPWHIIPSNKKWFRNLLISDIIVETLEKLDMKYPKIADRMKDS